MGSGILGRHGYLDLFLDLQVGSLVLVNEIDIEKSMFPAVIFIVADMHLNTSNARAVDDNYRGRRARGVDAVHLTHVCTA